MKHIRTITDRDITGSDKLSSAEPRIAVNAVLLVVWYSPFDVHMEYVLPEKARSL